MSPYLPQACPGHDGLDPLLPGEALLFLLLGLLPPQLLGLLGGLPLLLVFAESRLSFSFLAGLALGLFALELLLGLKLKTNDISFAPMLVAI